MELETVYFSANSVTRHVADLSAQSYFQLTKI